MTRTTVALAALLSSVLLAACGDSAEARELRDATRDVLDKGQAWVTSSWQEFRGQADQRLDRLADRIEALDEATRDQREQVAGRARELREALTRQLEAARRQLDDLKQRGGEGWQDGGERVREAVDALGQGVDRAWRELRGR
ncbi:MAG: hypothetical protein IPM29_31380 [Planctomycetes bacterium]|nr:hypothetical protein [Planctomycetota bacterium]